MAITPDCGWECGAAAPSRAGLRLDGAMDVPTPASVRSRLTTWLASPVTQTDLLQTVKAVVAAVLAWVVAEDLLGLDQAFLAPWVALLTVHATVYRTVWRGVETVLSVGIGIVLALSVVQLLGVSVWSFGLALLIGLALARIRLVREEGVTIATTALFVITTGYDTSEQLVIASIPDRLLATAIGVGVALAVNLLVLPPLNDRSAQQQVDDVDRRLGELLTDMARQLRRPWESQDEDDWIERSRSIDGDLERAWSLVRNSQESRSWNPRAWRHPERSAEGYSQVLERLEEGIAQTRGIARHLRESSREATAWDPRFRDRYIDLLHEVGRRVADPDADVADLREELQGLVQDLSTEDLSGLMWPLYGTLLANLRIIIDVVDDVATSRPVRT